MTFPVLSVSVETKRCKRFIRVMERGRADHLIKQGEVFACKKVVNTNVWSQHAWGNAVDLILKDPSVINLHDVAMNAFHQATKRTIANRGVRVPIQTIIWTDRAWVYGRGWEAYTGEYHNHVHVDFRPPKEGTPPCA